ncbi:SDR family NAD(P)-dependent oxidoreductase [Streptomyces sp. NPDC049577]|uniref:SDR family NAD(P)-dependent oxidoreductase n=1 Tax=Streptomyces sp. NPDC049577 TaxID=3155153 RepID=UPI0034491E47
MPVGRLSTSDNDRAIAVVGAGCRLPGGITDLPALWAVLEERRDLIGPVPADRFDARMFVDSEAPRRGKSHTAAGGFLSDIAGFDAAYFGISPREAEHMDPQQRLLLEMAVEALDDAGIPAAGLAGSDTGVFVGVSDHSYITLQLSLSRTVNPYTVSGGVPSIGANRLSHFFDLRGPSMTIDTACSSSLVAVDRACRHLWEGGGRTALAGGVNLLISPQNYVGFSQAGMLSRRGRCAAFSAGADGFVRAEGGGVVVLKRLADALADGDRIHAVIAGTGTNCDGRTQGLALPSAQAQEDLLRAVYERAGVLPDDLVYFEAHGTGTPAGDPVEARAVGEALGRRRTGGALPIGSVKSNLGHLEPASGMAGLFKALLVLRHGRAPATLHAAPLHPDIDFAGLNLAPTVEPRPLALTERSAVGVNSFGFGGANAHVVLTGPPAPAPPPAGDRPERGRPLPVVVSARSAGALRELALRVADRLAEAGPEEFYDLAHTATLRRSTHPHRAVVIAGGPPEAASELRRLFPESTVAAPAAGSAPRAGAVGRARDGGTVAFVFSGNGSQWPGMAADLMVREPVFRAAVDEADAALAPYLGWSVAKRLDTGERAHADRTEIAQPLLFAVQLGLVALLADRGVRPATVFGHGVGEIAAAHTAGALGLDAAARVVTERSRAQAVTAGGGRMAAAGLPEDEARRELARYPGLLEIAGINSDRDVTVAGDPAALAALGAELTARQVFFRDLGLDHAFHSRAMDVLREPLAKALSGLVPAPSRLPMVSTVTGAPVGGEELTAGYWWRNVREPVRFAEAAAQVLEAGAGILLEIGPHPVLRPYLRRALASRAPAAAGVCLSTLRREADGVTAVAGAVAGVLAAGGQVETSRHFPRPGRVVDLPAYPWQRERHWSGAPQSWVMRTGGDGVVDHPLLGERLPAPHPLWSGPVEPVLVRWLGDHQVAGSVVMPATGYVEMALAAGRRALGGPVELEHARIHRPLAVPWPDPGALRTQVAVTPDDGVVTVTSTDGAAGEPREHLRARVRTLLGRPSAPLDARAVRARCGLDVEGPELYRACEDAGLRCGPAFRVLRGLRVGDGEVLASYRHDADEAAGGSSYEVHPALLDGALQAGAPLLLGDDASGPRSLFLPSSFGAVRVWRAPSPAGLVHVRERSRTDAEVCLDITMADDDGSVTVEIDGCRLRRLGGDESARVVRRQTVLRAAPRPGSPPPPCPLPTPSEVAAAAAGRIDALRAAWRETPYERFASASKECLAHVWAETLAGFLPDPRAPFDMAALTAGGLQARHRRLVKLMLPLLERHGLLSAAPEERWHLAAEGVAPADRLRKLLAGLPVFAAESALFARQARHLGDVLRGARDPLELLGTDGPTYQQFFDIAPVSRFHHRILQALVRELVARWPGDRPLRVLEAGAGTGGTTAALLPLLPPERARYIWTDVSPASFAPARHRFAGYDFVEFRTLDLDADPGPQGFPEGGFDLVVAGHALHAANDVGAALRRVGSLLAPGGRLLAVEAHDPERLAALFGALESFWRRADRDVRPHSVLLPRDRWPGLLEECGFTDVVQTGDDRAPARDDHSVLFAAVPDGRPAQAPPLPPAGPGGTWIVAAETGAETPLAQALNARLAGAAGGTATVTTTVAGTAPDAWSRLLETAAADPGTAPPPTIAVLFGEPHDEPGALTEQTTRRAALLRAVTAACLRLPEGVRPRVWLVTRPSGLLPGPERSAFAGDAAVWGMGRSLANEQPRMDVRRVSLDRAVAPEADARRLACELLAPCDEDEIVLTSGGRFVPRETEAEPDRAPLGGAARSFALRVRDPGRSYRLCWQECAPPRPGAGEVAVAVRAAGLNYRDTLRANGLLPLEAVEGTPWARGLGMECAGVVTEVGPGVTRWAAGDRVFGLAPAALASHTVTPAGALARVPAGMGFAEAATLPVVFATVHYGLDHLARLAPDETVLVHGGADGVGLAVVQYARARGAHVIATAGTGAKRDWLRALGVEHVLDSRSLEFAPRVRELTDGRGVDIVVNSLAGEAMARGLDLLRPGGRFLELGKRDIYENKPLPLRPFDRNLAFFGVDLNVLLADPRLGYALFADVAKRVRAGTYWPLPHSVHPAARVEEAFRLLQHSRHIGKVVVSFDPLDEAVPVTSVAGAPRLDSSGTYLVTGGLGGFGAATAGWLAGLGARQLALVSRRGERAPEAAGLLARLAAQGVRATAYAADVTDAAAVRRVVGEIDATGHPLRGVVHCAAHIDDAPLTELDDERCAAVLAPKTAGGAVLDVLTRDRPLDLFLMYSSVSASIGNIHQAPYAAGNAYLEALVRGRRAAGLPGTAIAWGAVAETGHVARHGMEEALERLGVGPVPPRQAFAAAGPVLAKGTAVAGIGRYRWARGRALLPVLETPRYRPLLPDDTGGTGRGRADMLEELAALPPAEAERALTGMLAGLLAGVLHMDAGQLDPARRLEDHGLDSLMGAELLVRIREQFDLRLSPTELLGEGLTLGRIAHLVHGRLFPGTGEEARS